MNGRIYDQHLGRFISADPFVQFPHSTQGYNRYSYVGNNPLSYTDPSGYFNLKKELGRLIGHVGPIVSVFCGGAYAACVGASTAISGYLQGATPGDALRAGAKAAALAYVGQQMVGNIGNAAKLGKWSRFTTATVHGLSQGALSVAGGGRFGDGFLAAFSGHMSAPYISSNPVAGTIQAAIIGGSVAKIGGGKFANGAITAAMVAAFGNVARSSSSPGAAQPGTAPSAEDIAKLKAELDALATDGTLSSARGFKDPDAAATEVLEATAPLSKKYGIEVGGNIQQGKDGLYRYTLPTIGTSDTVAIGGHTIGYHTHPSGDLRFSNLTNQAGAGIDSQWVKVTGNPLYLGVELQNAHIGIAVCEPSNCSSIEFGGTRGRVIQ